MAKRSKIIQHQRERGGPHLPRPGAGQLQCGANEQISPFLCRWLLCLRLSKSTQVWSSSTLALPRVAQPLACNGKSWRRLPHRQPNYLLYFLTTGAGLTVLLCTASSSSEHKAVAPGHVFFFSKGCRNQWKHLPVDNCQAVM